MGFNIVGTKKATQHITEKKSKMTAGKKAWAKRKGKEIKKSRKEMNWEQRIYKMVGKRVEKEKSGKSAYKWEKKKKLEWKTKR